MGMRCAVPGTLDHHPAVIKRQQLAQQLAEVVEAVERGLGKNKDELTSFLLQRSGFSSKKAVAFRSLVYVKMRQDWVNPHVAMSPGVASRA
jgi:hypothetical protein